MPEDANSLPGCFAMFSAKDGKPSVVARFENDNGWLTQKHIAELFGTTKQNIGQHVKSILESGELDRNRTVKKYLTVQTEGERFIGRHVEHYNLDMIIALGYRIDSPIAVKFHQWATLRLPHGEMGGGEIRGDSQDLRPLRIRDDEAARHLRRNLLRRVIKILRLPDVTGDESGRRGKMQRPRAQACPRKSARPSSSQSGRRG